MESSAYKIIGLFLACFLSVACSDIQNEPYRLSDGDKASLSTGDIILRRGHGMLSTFIVKYLNDSTGISHCGVIVREGDSINVIHCLSDDVSDIDGVQMCSLDDFIHESVPGSVSVVSCTADTAGYLADGALYYLNTGKKFDREFDSSDTTKFYCSEMLLHIMSDKMNLKFIDSDKEFRFSLFFNPDYFKTIIKDR